MIEQEIHDHIKSVLKPLVYVEINDEVLRHKAITVTKEYMDQYVRDGKIYEYKVTCDSTNNTPDIVDYHKFLLNLYIRTSPTDNITDVSIRIGPEDFDWNMFIDRSRYDALS